MNEFIQPLKQVPASMEPASRTYRFTFENEKYPYLFYLVTITYWRDSGLRQLPVAGIKEPADIVRLYSPLGKKVVTFHAVRRGKKPEVPDPLSTDPNEVLEYSSPVVETPTLEGDGKTWVYESQGEYTYLLRRPLGAKDNFVVPRVPFATSHTFEHNVPSSAFKQELR